MAILHPFRALRPVRDRVRDVACVPYDVVSVSEARQLADGNPLSFLHVVRPEIDLPEGTDEHDDAVYAKGAENLREWAAGPTSIQDDASALFVYRLIMDGRSQTGIFGCVSVDDYDRDVILKHELTRPTKEDDRTRHIIEQQAHAEPVMLTFRDRDGVSRIIEQSTGTTPLYDFEADDGVQHTIWRVANPDRLVEEFGAVDHLYVADGHHRCKAASRAAAESAGSSKEAEYFPAVLFPMGQMHIMPYNRIIRALPNGPSAFLEELRQRFDIREGVDPAPASKGDISVFLNDTWYGMTLPAADSDDVVAGLDVGRLSDAILEPMLGITDPRRDPNIDFVGGIRGTAELERLVTEGKAEMAISMYPTGIDELVDVSDAGELMPPKSTWFEPKLRSGLLVHLF